MKQDLLQKIETKKKEMIGLGLQLGLTHPLCVQVSQELDELINHFMNTPLSEV